MDLEDSDSIHSLTFLADNAHLASGTKSGRISLWDVVTGIRVLSLEGHAYGITCLSASPRESLLASGSWDRTVRIWNTTLGVCLFTLSAIVRSLAFFPDGGRLAIGCEDGWLRLWNFSTKETQSYKLKDGGDLEVAVSNDGKLLAAATYGQSDVVIFDTTNFSNPVTVFDGGESSGCMSFPLDNSQLVIVGGRYTTRGFVQMWNIQSQACRSFEHFSVEKAAISPDGTRIVSGTEHRYLSRLTFSLFNS